MIFILFKRVRHFYNNNSCLQQLNIKSSLKRISTQYTRENILLGKNIMVSDNTYLKNLMFEIITKPFVAFYNSPKSSEETPLALIYS